MRLGTCAAFAVALLVAGGAAYAPGTPAEAGSLRGFMQTVKTEIYRTQRDIQTQHQSEVQAGIHYRKLMRGDPAIRAVALTFDDGPHPKYTPQLLAILKKYNVKATFFVVGKMAKQSPWLVRAEVKAGHVVGNHTYNHVNLTRIPPGQVEEEWRQCSDAIKSITGKSPKFCRPPGGDYNRTVIDAAAAAELTTVFWTDDPGDYASPGTNIIEDRTLRRIDNGGIILIHDGVEQTIQVLPQIIESLKKRGFRFQTVDEMARVAQTGN